MKRYIFSTLSLLLVTFIGHSQATPSNNPIDREFSELIENSNNFKGYKVVDFNELTTLQDKTEDYIGELKNEITGYEVSLQTQKDTIKKLKADLAKVENQLAEVTAEKDSISFLGMALSKSTYSTVMWGIVGVLVLAVVLLLARFKSSNARTKESRKKLIETEKEFEIFRAKALEKEQRMGRQLQDERNKHMKVAK
jgi:preprotein translocase subunit SecF